MQQRFSKEKILWKIFVCDKSDQSKVTNIYLKTRPQSRTYVRCLKLSIKIPYNKI